MHEAVFPRFVQLSQGCPRLHFSFRCLQGAHDSGIRLRFRTTRNCALSGDAPFEDVDEGGVGWLGEGAMAGEQISTRSQ